MYTYIHTYIRTYVRMYVHTLVLWFTVITLYAGEGAAAAAVGAVEDDVEVGENVSYAGISKSHCILWSTAYVLTYVHTYIRTYIHTYIHTYIRTYIHLSCGSL